MSSICFDHEDILPIKKDIKQEIKSESLDEVEEVHEGSNNDEIKRSEEVSSICFVHEGKKFAMKEIKQEVKNELWDEVEEVYGDYVIKRALDVSNTGFDHGGTFPIKQEIKDEPLDEDNVDVETHSYEDDPMIIDGQNDPKTIDNNPDFKEEYYFDEKTHFELELFINEMTHKYQWTFCGEPWIPNPIIQNHFLGPLLDSQFPRKDV